MKAAKLIKIHGVRLLVVTAFMFLLLSGFASPAAAAQNTIGEVYTLTNAAGGNAVLVFERATNGNLSLQGSYPTGGLGSGAGLGSQGAAILGENNHWLFAVNAGSNQVSVFEVQKHGLNLVDIVGSGGSSPISLTLHEELLYVLNAGGSGNISGFSVNEDGSLTPMPGSTQPLSNDGIGAAPGPAEIAFGSDGTTLVVTEKATNLIDTYQVEDGIAAAPVAHTSSGATPFGFAFDQHNHLIVSEAFGGAANSSAVSSYFVHEDEFDAVSPSIATTQTAACWIAISKNGKYAYTTNAGSGTISSYGIGSDGALTLLNPAAGSTGAGSSPVDMAFSNNGAYLYALGAAAHTISIFQMSADGSLVSLGSIGVPAGVVGLAAR